MWTRLNHALIALSVLVREYDLADISAMPATGTTNPGDPHGEISIRRWSSL